MTTLPKDIQRHWGKIGPLLAIRTEPEYDLAVERLNHLLDEVGDDERHPLYSLLDTLSDLIYDYEERNHQIMPSRDIYHDIVVNALILDGWTITDDPLRLFYGGRNVYIDLGAEYPIGAEKGGRKIAVEIKSFIGPSDVYELGTSIGHYNLYRDLLAELEPDRELYMAIPSHVFEGIFQEPIGQLVLKHEHVHLIVFDSGQERISQWIS